MQPTTYGYARVSSRDQNLDRQVDALLAFGVPRRRIYEEKASGRDFERPMWRELTCQLRTGDVPVVSSIDRMGRSYREVLDQWRLVTRERGAHVVADEGPARACARTEQRGTETIVETLQRAIETKQLRTETIVETMLPHPHPWPADAWPVWYTLKHRKRDIEGRATARGRPC